MHSFNDIFEADDKLTIDITSESSGVKLVRIQVDAIGNVGVKVLPTESMDTDKAEKLLVALQRAIGVASELKSFFKS